MTINRDEAKGPIGIGQRAWLERLRGHLGRAYAMHHLPKSPNRVDAIGHMLLTELAHPTWVIDRERRVLFRNRAAGELLGRRELLREQGGILVALESTDDRRLDDVVRRHFDEMAVGAPVAPHPRVVRLIGDASLPPVPLFVTTLLHEGALRGAWGDTPVVMLTLHDRNEFSPPDERAVASAFQLTPAESRVAVSIARGRTVEQIAVEQSVAVATVRSHVKALFQKTGARRQSDLVRLLAGLPDGVALAPPGAPASPGA